jgi:hypothetical protein
VAPEPSKADPSRFLGDLEAPPSPSEPDHVSPSGLLGMVVTAFGLVSSATLAMAIPGGDNVRHLAPRRARPRVASIDRRAGIFVSSCEDDRKYERLLRTHLDPVIPPIKYFSSAEIPIGSRWRERTQQALISSSVAVLLISAQYLASPEIKTGELPELLAYAANSRTIILSLIIRYSMFSRTDLANYHPVNSPSKPLADMRRSKQEEVMNRLAYQICRIFEQQGLIIP